jgi:hypothetical protein
MREFYHYTLEKFVPLIMKTGIYSNHPYYTTTEYYNADEAGQALGVMAHNIDCVLKFSDDEQFKRYSDVPATGRFTGGGNQYQHPERLKPIAKRSIGSRNWIEIRY